MKNVVLILTTIFWGNLLFAQSQSFDTTLINNKKSFKIHTKEINDNLALLIMSYDSKIILSDTLFSKGLAGIEFPDFNKDNNSDILIRYIGNISITQIYLFDPTSNEFKKVEGFDKFPEAIQLSSNPSYYYSYHRAGCADMNWISDLFIINNFKTILLGHMFGQGCDNEIKTNPQVIEIYKVKNNNEQSKILFEKLPYQKYIPNFEDKLLFIKKYWNENAKIFK